VAAAPVPPSQARRSSVWLCIGALVVAGALTYANSLTGPLILDDQVSIVENSDIRQVWSASGLRSASGESPVIRRPLVTFSFAINYAIGGLNVRGYHVASVAIHILCALALFGLIRRVRGSVGFAFACASLWMLHPLNSEAVDYLSQRTELMMGFFYFLTLYASVRAHASTRPAGWLAVAVLSSALGMACKQTMVTVPLAVMLIDRAFFFESWTATVRRRWPFYTALAATWLVLLVLNFISPTDHSMGFAAGVSTWTYLLNQSRMITRYLALAIWPDRLVMHYGYPLALALGDVIPQMLFISMLLALSVVAFWRRPSIGVLGILFFLTLSPASSLVPIATEVGAERRMYVPLAALVILAVCAVASLAERIRRSGDVRLTRAVAVSCVALWAAASVSLAALTAARNREYASPVTLARVTVERWPTGQGRHFLAIELLKAGRREEAIAALREAVRDDPRAHYTLGLLLYEDGRTQESREHLQEFLRLQPLLLEAVDARVVIGRGLFADRQLDAAAEQFELALKMQPSSADAHLGLGEVRFSQERFEDAIVSYRAFLKRGGIRDGVLMNLGIALQHTGKIDEAIQAFRRASELNPKSSSSFRNLAVGLLAKGQVDEAVQQARQAVALSPADPLAHDLLGLALLSQRNLDEAIVHFQDSARLNPADVQAQTHLREALQARRSGGGR
jgi:tetratricopeptide (TPR) repeat protein